jgi:hypothetical protein
LELKVAIMSGCFILETSEIEPKFIAAGNAGDVCGGRGRLQRRSPERQRFAPGFFPAGGGALFEGRSVSDQYTGFIPGNLHGSCHGKINYAIPICADEENRQPYHQT